MWTFFLVALRNLIQARRRTLLLGSAIAFVSLLLLLLLSISKGVSDRLIEASTLTSTGHVNVAGFYKQRANSATPLITDREKIRSLVQENISGLALVTDRARGWGRLIGSGGSFNTGLNGLILEESAFLKEVKLAEQSEYKKDGANKVLGKIENFGARNTILIFAGQAKKLGVDVSSKRSNSQSSRSTRKTVPTRFSAKLKTSAPAIQFSFLQARRRNSASMWVTLSLSLPKRTVGRQTRLI